MNERRVTFLVVFISNFSLVPDMDGAKRTRENS